MSPLIAVHMSAALGAVVLGPVVIWARKGAVLRPRLHRAFGYGFVTLMLGASIGGMFIRDFKLPNIAGYTPIHLLTPVTLLSLWTSFYALYQGNIEWHRKTMVSLYLGACVTAGAFTLLPSRYLGQLIWGQSGAFIDGRHAWNLPMTAPDTTHETDRTKPVTTCAKSSTHIFIP
jgi:uncharacterized membrane protein